MFYKFIFWFLLFTIMNVMFMVDIWFVIFIVAVFFVSYIFTNKNYRTEISKMSYMSFMFLMSFILSYVLVQSRVADERMFHLEKSLYQIRGKVVDISSSNTTKIVSLNVASIDNLSNGSRLNEYPSVVKISVSPFVNVQLFDELETTGEIITENSQNNLNFSAENFIPKKYSHEKLFLNSGYHVSNLKNFKVIQGNYYQKTLGEKIKISFYETSENLQSKVDKHMKDPYVGVAKGITFGNQESIIKDIKMSFINSGLIHIMVLSGANVSFIILLFFWLLNYLSQTKYRFLQKIDLKTKILTTIFMSSVFVFGTGLAVPSLRALVMVNTSILAEYFSRNFSIKKSILISLCILTLINPFVLVYSVSLHLSYLAVIGLIFVLPKINTSLDKIIQNKSSAFAVQRHDNLPKEFEVNILTNSFRKNIFKNIVATFLAITISVGPYLLAISEQINFAGTIFSIILEPIILSITVITFLITLVSSLSIFISYFASNLLANFFGLINTFLVSIVIGCAEFLSHDMFIYHTTINMTLVKIYYLFFLIYFFVVKDEQFN